MSNYYKERRKFLKKQINEGKIGIEVIERLFAMCPDFKEDPRKFVAMTEGVLMSKKEFLVKEQQELEELKDYKDYND